MLDKIIKIMGWCVLGFAALVSILFFALDAPSLSAGVDALGDATADVRIAGVDQLASDWGGFILNCCIVFTVLCALLFAGFEIGKVIADGIANPKNFIMPAIVVVAFAVTFIISYALASDAIPQTVGIMKMGISNTASKWSETLLFVTYIFFGATIVALLYGAISKLWK